MANRSISTLERTDPNIKGEAETSEGKLHFEHFPGYARYLAENKVYDFAVAQLHLSRKNKLPVLKYFETFNDEQLIALGIESTTEVLSFFAQNKAEEFIELSVHKWKANQLSFISPSQVDPEDITLLSFIRRKLFRDFLPSYTSDINLYVKIMEEVDRFTVEFDTICLKTLIKMQEDLYKQAQALAHIGNWIWDLQTKKLTWSDEMFRIYEMEPQSSVPSEHIAEYNHPDDAAMISEQMERSRKTLEPHDFYYRIILKGQREKILHAKGQVVLNEYNEPHEMFGTLQDVTNEKQNEKELSEKQNFIQKIADVTPCLIAAYNVHTGKYIFVNKALKPLLGYDAKEVLEKGIEFFISLIHPDDLHPLREKNARELEKANQAFPASGGNEPIVEFTYRLKHASGEYRWFQTYGTIFNRNNLNQVEHVINVSVDITEEFLLSQQLNIKNEEIRKNEERYLKMISEVEDYVILLLDKDGTIQSWNKGAEKIKGYRTDEIIGKNFRVFYTKEDQQSGLPEKLIREAWENGKAIHEGWRVRKNGTTFWGYIVITALHDKEGNIIGFTKVTRDLTERKIAEDKLRQYSDDIAKKNVELQRINKELESFNYMASHDLQEPLRKIRTFCGLILKKPGEQLSPDIQEYFNRIIGAAERMQKLIEDLLNYSNTNAPGIRYELTSLNDIVDEVKKNLDQVIEEKNATIECGPLPALKIVPGQFLQLFTNLIDNALKYSRSDAAPVIKISSRKLHPKKDKHSSNSPYVYKISVADNGIGFEKEYAEKIFGLFQRLHAHASYAGTGIGLAICKKIVQNHKGIITATGKPGVGATFDIYLPAE